MKRAELLRQLDLETDSLKCKVDHLVHRLNEFKEGENQKVPKWAMTPKKTRSDITAGKWYPIIKYYLNGPSRDSFDIYGDTGICWYCLATGCAHLNGGDWELCYDDKPPEDKLRTPKWVKRIDMGDPRVRLGHWYKVIRAYPGNCGLEVQDENGGVWTSAFPIDPNYWEPCYDDSPPNKKSKTPKWGRCPTSKASYVTAGKWYRITRRITRPLDNFWEFVDNVGDKIHFPNPPTMSMHTNSVWELCYEDQPPTPPVEKKVERPRVLDMDEKTQRGDIRIAANGHTMLITGLAGEHVRDLLSVKKCGAIVIRLPDE